MRKNWKSAAATFGAMTFLTLGSLTGLAGADEVYGDSHGPSETVPATTIPNYGDSHGPSELEDPPPTTVSVYGDSHGPSEIEDVPPVTTIDIPVSDIGDPVTLICYSLPQDGDAMVFEIPCNTPVEEIEVVELEVRELAVTGALTDTFVGVALWLLGIGGIFLVLAGREKDERSS